MLRYGLGYRNARGEMLLEYLQNKQHCSVWILFQKTTTAETDLEKSRVQILESGSDTPRPNNGRRSLKNRSFRSLEEKEQVSIIPPPFGHE